MAEHLHELSAPAENNAVINTLPLVLWSSNRVKPQFKYVLDVYYYGSQTRLSRVKFANNVAANEGAGIIDLAPIIQSYIDYDEPWYTTGSSFTQENNARRFQFIAGEEYAATYSSSAVLYDGDGNVGEPAYTASENNLFLAVNEFNDTGSYNWNISNYTGSWLTNQTYTSSAFPKTVYNGDYETISLLDNLSGSINLRIENVVARVKNNSTTLHSGNIGSIATTPFNTEMLRYVGVGPQNLSDLNSSFESALSGDWTNIEIEVSASASTDYKTYYFENGNCTNYDKTRFAFINKLGTWDYYNMDFPTNHSTDVKKEITLRTPLQYQKITGNEPGLEDPVLTVPVYDADARGEDIYYMEYTDKFRVSTDWLTEQQANWLTELLTSPNVYRQRGSKFEPINITNSKFKSKTNKRNQKTFKYDFQYQLANKRIARY